ncbi:MAG TPA: GldG family protein, partial [Mariprofundaceae bacterium]|nr:GldG family protein [Mariprofundaceae bacterium]
MASSDNTTIKPDALDRRISIRRRAWGTLMLTLMAAVIAFAAAQVSHVRLDLTEDRVYSLSDSTRAILSQLDEPVMVHAYITADLPQPYGRLRRFIEDMLMSYHDAGGGKFGYNIVDPSSDANLAASLNAMKIPKVRVQVVEDDQAQVKQGYLAIVIEYLDKKETIPVVQSEEGFEYLLTRKIKKLTGKGRVKVGLVSGFGAHGLQQMERLQQIAGDDYEFVDVEPADREIPADVKALVVAGVREKPSPDFRYRVDQFRMSGRGLFVLAGNVIPELMRGFQVQAVDPYANAWLDSDLGVVVDPGLVLDKRATRVVVNQQQGMIMMRSAVDYPFVIKAMQLDTTHPVSKGLESVTVPFASPLLWSEKVKGGRVLATSSPGSAVQSGPPFDVDPLIPMRARFEG